MLLNALPDEDTDMEPEDCSEALQHITQIKWYSNTPVPAQTMEQMG